MLISKFPLSDRSLLQKDPKFAPTPQNIPYKDIVAQIESAIYGLSEKSKHEVRTMTAAVLKKASLPNHKNINKQEQNALHRLKKEHSRVIMEVHKGNCFVVLDRDDYDLKLEVLLSERNTYEPVTRSPFSRIERELNATLQT
mgnify:CR=1 FL=1